MTTHEEPVTIDARVSAADEAAVRAGLLAFNEARLGPANEQPVALVARDEAGRVVGGVLGHTRWRWLHVAKLWVHDSRRGTGVGSRLLAAAEACGRERGCTDVVLDTFEFQARPFYERHGYEVFGELEGYPPGYRQYFLRKRL